MSYLTLLPEIAATVCASFTTRELLVLFESVDLFEEKYWNHQGFWTTLFHLKISTFIPLNIEPIGLLSDYDILPDKRVTGIRASYLAVFELKDAILTTQIIDYKVKYLHLIGRFNSKILIQEFFETLNSSWNNLRSACDPEPDEIPYRFDTTRCIMSPS